MRAAVVQLLERWYEHDDAGVLPRFIASFEAFETAMRLDVAMGGSTNTVLHLLAAAHEAEVPFTMQDIDRISRSTPHLCAVSPSVSSVHIEDVHRAGGVMGILGVLDVAGLVHRGARMVHTPTLAEALDRWDVGRSSDAGVQEFYRAAPGGVRTTEPFSQSRRYPQLDLDRSAGVVRDPAHAFSEDGGLAVLYGNLATDGCIVKTAGVDPSVLQFDGRAIVFESENDAGAGILTDVRASVAQQELGELAAARAQGTIAAEIFHEADRSLRAHGELVFVDSQIDAATGTVPLKVRLVDSPPALLSGQAVRVRLLVGVEPAARVVPEAALQHAQEGPYVYVVRDRRAVVQPVKPTRGLDGEYVVEGALRAGEPVLIDIPQRLKAGSKVRI